MGRLGYVPNPQGVCGGQTLLWEKGRAGGRKDGVRLVLGLGMRSVAVSGPECGVWSLPYLDVLGLALWAASQGQWSALLLPLSVVSESGPPLTSWGEQPVPPFLLANHWLACHSVEDSSRCSRSHTQHPSGVVLNGLREGKGVPCGRSNGSQAAVSCEAVGCPLVHLEGPLTSPAPPTQAKSLLKC